MDADIDKRALLRVLATGAASVGIFSPLALIPSAQAATKNAADVPLTQLRIGYQKSAVNLVIAKQLGWLEKRLPATKVSWLEFPAGPQLLEALSVGSLEFGLTGDAPPVFAQAAGKDLVYVGAEPPKPDSSAILTQADSPLRTLADLKGRKVALQKGSSAHYLLVRAVEKAGLQWSDIQPIYLTPADARAAFERKSVDAWAGDGTPPGLPTSCGLQPPCRGQHRRPGKASSVVFWRGLRCACRVAVRSHRAFD